MRRLLESSKYQLHCSSEQPGQLAALGKFWIAFRISPDIAARDYELGHEPGCAVRHANKVGLFSAPTRAATRGVAKGGGGLETGDEFRRRDLVALPRTRTSQRGA